MIGHKLRRSSSKVKSNSPILLDTLFYETYANNSFSKSMPYDLNGAPPWSNFVLISVNSNADNIGIPVNGSSGGTYNVNVSGWFIFVPGTDFSDLVGTDSRSSRVSITFTLDEVLYGCDIQINVIAVPERVDPRWSDVEFLIAAPVGGVGSIVDSKGKYGVNIVGTPVSEIDPSYGDTLQFPSSPRTVVGIGNTGDFAWMIDGLHPWTVDGWWNITTNGILFGMGDHLVGSGLLFNTVVSSTNINLDWKIFNKDHTFLSKTQLSLVKKSTWNYIAFQFDPANLRMSFMVNNTWKYVSFNAGLPFPATSSEKLYIGGRKEGTDAYGVLPGKITGVRLTRGIRYNYGDTLQDHCNPPFPLK